jgi:hypothetical protein
MNAEHLAKVTGTCIYEIAEETSQQYFEGNSTRTRAVTTS